MRHSKSVDVGSLPTLQATTSLILLLINVTIHSDSGKGLLPCLLADK